MTPAGKRESAVWKSTSPVISFTFDDFPRSAYRTGGAVLADLEIQATYYAALGHMQSNNEFSEDDLQNLVNDGHEMACHTYGHTSALDVSAEAFAADCDRNREAAAQPFPDIHLENFAYPYGRMTPAAVAWVSRNYKSARTTIPGINVDRLDLSRLHGVRVYDHLKNLSEIAGRIEENAGANGWLIFYTHDVSNQPTNYGCSPDLLREVALLAKGSGADILTVRDALRRAEILPRTPPSKVVK